jgi:hypothetical protein
MEIFIAGAGAGKTTTMADKIVKLHEEIEEYKIIFCITFTNNAVACIEKKLTEYYGEIPDNIIVSTIHSFLYREFVKPYYYLLYGKQYERISIAELPSAPIYKNGKIKRLEERNILHQTVIPERAKWVVYKKSSDIKKIENRRSVIKKNFIEYCGAICIDEAQDIDVDMQIIIETLHKMGIRILMMGDPKQDLKGHKCLDNLIAQYKNNVEYIDICYRCPQIHLKISNLLVKDSEQQYSEKDGGLVSVVFETDKPCSELIKANNFDLSYISKKQGKYDTHEQSRNYDAISAISEEIEAIIRKNHSDSSEVVLRRAAYFYAEKLMELYKNTNNKAQAMNATFKNEKIGGTGYGILINMIPDNNVMVMNNTITVNSIDSIKGKEGENCLFILTTDLASYMFGNKKDNTITKNRLYVALTRSLDKLTIFITEEVEKKYGKKEIIDFFNKIYILE